MYGFLLVFCNNFVRKTHRFSDIRLRENAATLKTGLGVREGHSRFRDIQCRKIPRP